jgi:ABC-type transporter Mla subunit MlaD
MSSRNCDLHQDATKTIKMQRREEQSRGNSNMEFQEEKRNEDTSRGSIAADKMAQDISSSVDKAKSNIAEAAESAKAEARRIANQQKDAGADKLGEVAGAVYGAARSLETGMPQMASYIHGAAARLEGAAKTLRHRSVDDLVEGIGNFARTQPVVFFAGAIVAGFALTRFLKSSGDDAGQGWRRAGMRGQ